ncbi:MAG TPA: FkbM family methyltransferase [Mycobacteriales bacterium]|jgi:FkbM family methyltransferase|nr:FkbM family methyltransferase [Mycobacteriales bacterium]
MTSAPFESFAQNAEDVVLWRALGAVPAGRYIDVGANDPVVDSITWAFYLRGWRGITAEPVASLAAAHRSARPEDVQVEAVIADLDSTQVVLHEIDGTGLSTISDDIALRHRVSGWTVEDHAVPVRRLDDVLAGAGWDDGRDIHLLNVDTEGAELTVLQSLDLKRYRPWVLVIEATAPNSAEQSHLQWEHLLLEADYTFCLFDGLSRFYVASEHADDLAGPLSYPACALDAFTSLPERRRTEELTGVRGELEAARAELHAVRQELGRAQSRVEELLREAVRWRTAALSRWSAALGGADSVSANSELGVLRNEVAAMRRTVSWRVTRPLRAVRSRAGVLRAYR